MASYLDKGTVRFILLAALFAFLLQARPPQQEVDPFERPVGWFPGASHPSNRSTRALQEAAPQNTPQFVTSVGITCGEPEGTVYVTSDGRTFVSDLAFLAPGTNTEENIGDFSFTPDFAIKGAFDQGLYVRERFGPVVYKFPNLENGVYEITLYETEAWYTEPGKRVFAVYVDDTLTTASSVDLFLQSGGPRMAVNLTLQQSVFDHGMVISFQPLVDMPKINAIWLQKVGELGAVPAPETVTPAPTDATAVEPLHYVSSIGISCGEAANSEPYFDDDGRKFVSDEPYYMEGTGIGVMNHTEKALNGEYTIQGTDDGPLYMLARFGPIVYQMPPLENGAYWITFYASEGYWTAPGQRVFNVSINGQPTEWAFVDLVARGGGPLTNANFGTFYSVKNHKMAIEFIPVINWPYVNAIYVQKVRELTPEELAPTPTATIAAPQATAAPVETPTPELPTPAPEISTPAPELPTPAPELPTPAPELPTPAPELPTPAPELPTPAPELSTPAPELPTPAPELPTPAPELPTPAPELPTPAPELPTPAPELPTPAPEVPTAAPEVSTQAPVTPAAGEGTGSAVDQTPSAPMPEEGQSMHVSQWILKGLPISFYSTLVCTAVAGPIAELFGYKTVVSIGAFARVLIQLVLLFGMPLAAAQIQYGIGAAADVILVAFLFLHVAERHFQLATSVVVAASAIGVVGAAAISQLMQFFMPDVLIQWLPLGSMLLAAFVASLLPQDPVRDEMDRTKGDRNNSARLPLRGFFGREGLLGEFLSVYSSLPICILSFWWIFASAVNASLLNYAPDLLTEVSPNAFFNQYAINIVHILSAVGALIAIKLAAPVARTGGWAYLGGSLIIGLAAVGALLMENLGTAYISLILTAGIAQMLLCLVFAQSATLVPNGRFALLFGTNATLALLVQGGTQLALDRMGWHIGAHFFVLGLASICGALLFGLLWTLHRCSTGRVQLVNTEDLAGDYNLVGSSQPDARTALPIYEIQDESTWKTDDVDDNDDDEGNVEMLGLVEGRPQVVKDEGSLSRI